jgi:hypothetical protein
VQAQRITKKSREDESVWMEGRCCGRSGRCREHRERERREFHEAGKCSVAGSWEVTSSTCGSDLSVSGNEGAKDIRKANVRLTDGQKEPWVGAQHNYTRAPAPQSSGLNPIPVCLFDLDGIAMHSTVPRAYSVLRIDSSSISAEAGVRLRSATWVRDEVAAFPDSVVGINWPQGLSGKAGTRRLSSRGGRVFLDGVWFG